MGWVVWNKFYLFGSPNILANAHAEMKYNGLLLPNGIENFLKHREDSETMSLFCEGILPHVVGKNLWKEGVYNMKVCDLASVTDEVFALLALENIWDEWVDIS